ncbi:MAG: hypothetical protein ORN25_10915 [Caulobacteraceae bacterium]|nr:hypothetical protein [Caulobacteraceae bacterium]
MAKFLRVNPDNRPLERSGDLNTDEKQKPNQQEMDKRFAPSPRDERTNWALFRQ